MTPLSPDEPAGDREVINVTGVDGETRRYQKRRMGMRGFRNGHFSNDFVEIVVKSWTIVKVVAGALATIVGAMWVLNERVILPQQQRMIERVVAEQLTPIIKRLGIDEKLFREHLLDIEKQRSQYPTRDDLREDLSEIKAMIRASQGGR